MTGRELTNYLKRMGAIDKPLIIREQVVGDGPNDEQVLEYAIEQVDLNISDDDVGIWI